MGLFDIVGDIVEIPFKAIQLPFKAARVAENIVTGDDIDSTDGALGAVEEVVDNTVGEVGRQVNKGISNMDD